MPQVDKVTFLSQFFWLCFFYIGFYFLVLTFFLPKMSRILKLRKNKLSFSKQGVLSLQKENDNISTSYETLLSNGLNTSRTAFNDNFKQTEKWSYAKISDTNKTHFQSLNNTYISCIGKASISQNLALSQVSLELPEEKYFSILFLKFKSLSNKNKSCKLSLKNRQISPFSGKLEKQARLTSYVAESPIPYNHYRHVRQK